MRPVLHTRPGPLDQQAITPSIATVLVGIKWVQVQSNLIQEASCKRN